MTVDWGFHQLCAQMAPTRLAHVNRPYRAEQYAGLLTADPPICATGPALGVLTRCERLRRGEACLCRVYARDLADDLAAIGALRQADYLTSSLEPEDVEKLVEELQALPLTAVADDDLRGRIESSTRQLADLADLGLAVGVSQGTTIAAKLGEYAHRDRICLGSEVLRAEENEERVGKFETGISGNVKDNLKPELAKHFAWSSSANCHVAKGLDHRKLDLEAAASAYSSGKNVTILSGAGPTISTVPGSGRQVTPARSWGE